MIVRINRLVRERPLTVEWMEHLFDALAPNGTLELHLTEKQDDDIAYEFVTSDPESVLHKLIAMLDIKDKHRKKLHRALYDIDTTESLPSYLHLLGKMMHRYMKQKGY